MARRLQLGTELISVALRISSCLVIPELCSYTRRIFEAESNAHNQK